METPITHCDHCNTETSALIEKMVCADLGCHYSNKCSGKCVWRCSTCNATANCHRDYVRCDAIGEDLVSNLYFQCIKCFVAENPFSCGHDTIIKVRDGLLRCTTCLPLLTSPVAVDIPEEIARDLEATDPVRIEFERQCEEIKSDAVRIVEENRVWSGIQLSVYKHRYWTNWTPDLSNIVDADCDSDY